MVRVGLKNKVETIGLGITILIGLNQNTEMLQQYSPIELYHNRLVLFRKYTMMRKNSEISSLVMCFYFDTQ